MQSWSCGVFGRISNANSRLCHVGKVWKMMKNRGEPKTVMVGKAMFGVGQEMGNAGQGKVGFFENE